MDDDFDDGREFYHRKLDMRQIDPVYRLEEERLIIINIEASLLSIIEVLSSVLIY